MESDSTPTIAKPRSAAAARQICLIEKQRLPGLDGAHDDADLVALTPRKLGVDWPSRRVVSRRLIRSATLAEVGLS